MLLNVCSAKLDQGLQFSYASTNSDLVLTQTVLYLQTILLSQACVGVEDLKAYLVC